MRYAGFIKRFSFLIAVLSVLLFAASFHYVKKLGIRSDFKEMLPSSAPSVVELSRIEKRVRSTDNLIVLVGGADWPTIRAFVDNFVVKLKAELGDDISRVEYNVTNVKNYYDRNKYLYIDLDDLKEIYTRLKTRIDWEKVKRTPLFVQFEEEEPKFDTKDIEDKYTSKTGRYQRYEDGYFTDINADLAAVMIWPKEPATNVEFSKNLISRIEGVIANTPGYGPPLKVAFAGRIKKMITEYYAIIGDIMTTSLLCIALVAAVVFLYYRKVRMGLLMIINVGQGTLMALSLAYFIIGYLTSQTAFLGSIIVGNGINFSLILMARYIEERRNKVPILDAVSIAMTRTWKPTLTAAIVTSASFAALILTQVRGINQFGIIGGMGMVLCWICTYTILPAWLCVFEKIWKTKVSPHSGFTIMEKFSKLVIGRSSLVLKISATLSVISIVALVWYLPNSLEYDFSKLSFKPIPVKDKWEEEATTKMNEIFGQSTSPSVVILNKPDQGQMFCDAIISRDPENRYVESCKTLYSFVPKEQEEKLSVLSDMRQVLSSSTLKFLNPDQLAEVEKFKSTFDLKPLTVTDVPTEIVDTFSDVDGNKGMLAFIYPKADLWNGRELSKFADILRRVELPDGDVILGSGQPVILADLLEAVVKEGPKVTLISFLLVLILVWISFIRWRFVSVIQFSLLTGVLWLIGFMGIAGIKLNFLNFVALPITFGIGVDYAVNIFQRYRQDGVGSIGNVIGKTGGAVVLCSLTTIIGYSVLLMSRSRALVSFGFVALMGEFTCLAAAIISLPAFIVWRESRKKQILEDSCPSTDSKQDSNGKSFSELAQTELSE